LHANEIGPSAQGATYLRVLSKHFLFNLFKNYQVIND